MPRNRVLNSCITGTAIALLISLVSTACASPNIEIWLSRGYGRFGRVGFSALGGRRSHPTPTGVFTVKGKDADFYSRKYKARMPLSVFFTDNCAIHVGSLRTESHGCIHVSSDAAAYLYNYATPGDTKVIVHP